MRYADLVEASRRVEEASGRNAKVEVLAELLRRCGPDEVEVALAHLSGRLPQRRIGVGRRLVAGVRTEPAEKASLALRDVHGVLGGIARASGPGSQARKADLLRGLLARATAREADFLRRLLVGELRQGALEGLMTDAVARAFGVPVAAVRRAAMAQGALGPVARAAREGGEAALARFSVTLFRPVLPMLAQPGGEVEEALDAIGGASIEDKLDGARIQVHRSGGDVAVYTRTLRDVTGSAPEIVAAARTLALREAILDGEALALDANGRPLPFQATMSRFSSGEPVLPFFFDVLRTGGADLIDAPLRERLEALDAAVPAERRVSRVVTCDPSRARSFLRDALARGHEGVMAKSLDSRYEAGRRGGSWLKVKPSHTLDLVVLAAEWGSGRRRGYLSNLHLGARGAQGFVMLGKTFKGLTDAMLEWQTARLLELEVAREAHIVHVRPELVVEVAFDGLQESTRYPGGLALRFARVRRHRPDKPAAEADTFEAVRALHARR